MPNKPRSAHAARIAANRKAYDTRRGTARDRGYDKAWDEASKAWRKLHPWCVYCERKGIHTLAQCVDHIRPIRYGGLVFDPDNLASSCFACNTAKVKEDERKYGVRN